MTETVQSLNYKHESACILFDPEHEVREEFINVLAEVVTQTPVETEWGAVGCTSCVEMDAPAGVFWVAQADTTHELPILYHAPHDTEFGIADLAVAIQYHAEQLGVPSSWNGDPANTVVLGTYDYYDENPFFYEDELPE